MAEDSAEDHECAVDRPVADLGAVVAGRRLARVDGEHKDVGTDFGVFTEPVGVLVPGERSDATEVQARVLRLRPALQVAGCLDLDAGARCAERVVVVPGLAKRSGHAEGGGHQELGEDAAGRVVTQVGERPRPEVADCCVDAAESVGRDERLGGVGISQPGGGPDGGSVDDMRASVARARWLAYRIDSANAWFA